MPRLRRTAASTFTTSGVCGTEGVYFACFHGGYDGGIHDHREPQPTPDYNGMKFVREQSKPISGDNGLQEIRGFAEQRRVQGAGARGRAPDHRHLGSLCGASAGRSYVDAKKLSKPLKIVVNAGNGGAGLIIDALEKHLPFEFIKMHHEPDGHFPNGIPNPMLEENRAPTAAAIRRHGADLGVAFGTAISTAAFFFDERGDFIEGYYIVGLLAQVLLPGVFPRRQSGARSAPDLEYLGSGQGRAKRVSCGALETPAMPSSSSACARSTASTAGR